MEDGVCAGWGGTRGRWYRHHYNFGISIPSRERERERERDGVRSFSKSALQIIDCAEERGYAARKVHTIVNLDDGSGFIGYELKAQVEWVDRRCEVVRVGFEGRSSQVASVGCRYRLMIEHQTDETFRRGAFVEIGSVRQLIRLADRDDQILVHTCRMYTAVGSNWTDLIEFVGERRIVTQGSDGVSGMNYVSCNPRGKAAFETAVLNNVVCWSGNTISGRC